MSIAAAAIFLSCLYGSALCVRADLTYQQFLSCLYGSAPNYPLLRLW